MASAVAINPSPASAKVAAGVSESSREPVESSAAIPDKVTSDKVFLDKATDETRWRPLLGLPGQLTVDLPLPDFTIADLLRLKVGSVMRTSWQVARDVPLRVNDTLIGWSEFEAVGNRLAVRLTELA